MDAVEKSVEKQIEEAVEFAKNSPDPSMELLMDTVLA